MLSTRSSWVVIVTLMASGCDLAAGSTTSALPPTAAAPAGSPAIPGWPPAAGTGGVVPVPPGTPFVPGSPHTVPPGVPPVAPPPGAGEGGVVIQPPGAFPSVERVIPTDERAVVTAAKAPVPVSGGTLLVSADGLFAYAADPERDRVSIVDLTAKRLVSDVALQTGDEPGRLVQDDLGGLHVVLRRAGAVASIDPWTHTVVARRAVCAAPRGIAFDANTRLLRVACSGGDIVSLPAAGSGELTRVRVDGDLRDVMPTPSGLFVSRAKSAELLALDANLQIATRTRPQTPRFLFEEATGAQIVDSLSPNVARRTIPLREGGFVMLHQGSRDGDIPVDGDPTKSSGGSPYGGSGNCRRVVTTELTKFDATGEPQATVQLPDVLVVDIAQSPVNSEVAVAVAGVTDPFQPSVGFKDPIAFAQARPVPIDPDAPPGALPGTAFMPGTGEPGEVSTVVRYDVSGLSDAIQKSDGCHSPTIVQQLPSPATAVAYLPDGGLVAQTREPAVLWMIESPSSTTGLPPTKIALGGGSAFDTGHELFHRDAGAGVACASCHLEGGDDGHVWHFVGQGARRTQSIDVGLEGTAPFHWIGDMSDVATLMEHVFVGRMGGVHQTPERAGALEHWMYAIQPPVPLRASDDLAATRGKALFAGEAECAKCHSGAKLTNNETVDVGTGLPLQVPSLVGVAYRSPWLHNGCANTLRDRFIAACGGGDAHGHTEQLTSTQLDDLTAYLETL
ncbi:MAG: c-type cytochrome [Polyangiales bacterium]